MYSSGLQAVQLVQVRSCSGEGGRSSKMSPPPPSASHGGECGKHSLSAETPGEMASYSVVLSHGATVKGAQTRSEVGVGACAS